MKICTKCGVEKGEGEFYRRGGKTRHGKAVTGLHSICKACSKARIAKRLAGKSGKEYEPLGQYRERIGCRKRARLEAIEKAKPPRIPPTPWDLACRRAISKLKRKDDPWTRRINGSAVSLRTRAPALKRARGRTRGGHTWNTCCSTELRRLTRKPKDAWTRKMQNVISSLRKRKRRRARAR